MSKFAWLFAVGLACAAGNVSAQPKDLKASPDKEWKHKATGIRFPARLAGLQRDSVRAFAGPETDIAGDYWSADGADTVTIYLYRNVSGSVPVWFDRARSLISLVPQKYLDPKATGIRPFTPRGHQAASGLMEIFSVGGKYRSTGVMLLPINGFYAKIRATSTTRDPAALEQLLLAAANSIDWTSRQKEPAAIPVADCASPLPVKSPAQRATVSKDDQMMSALIGGVVAQAASASKPKVAPTYCREPGSVQIAYGVYRPDSSAERYMMAQYDAGRAIVVGSSDLTQILLELKTAPRVSVTHVDLERTITYGDFASVPLPEHALEMVEKTAPLSVASTWGGKRRDVTINTAE